MKMQKHNIHNYDIVPFNEYFYRNCFYNNLLTVLKSFKKNTMELLLNDQFIFVLKEYEIHTYLSVNYISYLPLQQFLSKIGIFFSLYDVKDILLKSTIIEHLMAGRIIIIWVDNFFLSYKVNAYNIKHSLSTLIVYGYNAEKSEFLVIDTNDNQRLNYQQFSIKDTVLISAYSGIFEMRHASSIIPYMTFYNTDIKCNSTNIDWKQVYNCEEMKKQSYQDILKLISNLHNDYPGKEICLKGLNEIVLAEEARCRVLPFILEEDKRENIMENSILNKWRKIRNICLKVSYTNQWDEDFWKKIICSMESIYFENIH